MLTSREAKELRSLRRRTDREESGRFLAEGIRVVEDLLAAELSIRWVVTASSLEDSERGAALAREVDRRGIVRRVLSDHGFAQFAATESPQGVIAVVDTPQTSIRDIQVSAPPTVVLILDAVQDPGNFGALARSAEAFGAAAVIALPGTVDPWNPKAVRAAAGSSFRVPIVQTTWAIARATLKERGFQLLGAAVDGEALPPEAIDRVALVVGNEGAGLANDIRAGVDAVVGIPIRGRVESLNVAAAAAILLYELGRC